MEERMKKSEIMQYLSLAHPFSMLSFIDKVHALFSAKENADESEKDLWRTAILWGAWRIIIKDLRREAFSDVLDDTWLEAYTELTKISTTSDRPDSSNGIISDVLEFDRQIEANMKSGLPVLPKKEIPAELKGAPRMYMYLYAMVNVGDDLFGHILFSRYPKVVFLMPYSESYKLIFEKYPNVLPNNMGEGILAAGYRMDLDYDGTKGYISLGGSVFPDFITYKFFMDQYYSEQFISRNKNMFFIGSNVDRHYRNPLWNIDTYNEYFSKHPDHIDICLRDHYSYEQFQASGCARVAPDIVFGLKTDFMTVTEEKERKGLGISMIETRGREGLEEHHDEYIKGLCAAIMEATKKQIPVTLFSFCKYEGDEAAIKDIMSRLSDEVKQNVRCNCYNGDLKGFLEDYASMEYIIATRFHASILALKFRQKLFPVVYSDKIQSLLADLGGFSGDAVYDVRTSNAWDTTRVFDVLDEYKANDEVIEQWEKLSEEHFLKLDAYLSQYK